LISEQQMQMVKRDLRFLKFQHDIETRKLIIKGGSGGIVAAGGVPQGSAFPTAPTTDELFHRFDLVKLGQAVAPPALKVGIVNGRWLDTADQTFMEFREGNPVDVLYEDDLTSYVNQTEIDTNYPTRTGTTLLGNFTTDLIDYNAASGNSTSRELVFDLLGTISDTAWVLRWIHTFTTLGGGANLNEKEMWIGMGDSDQTVVSSTAQDFIGYAITKNQTSTRNGAVNADNAAIPQFGQQFATVPVSGQVRFMEIVRDSATQFTCSKFINSDFTNLQEAEVVTIPATIINLRFLKLMTVHEQNADTTNIGTIGNPQLANGVTVFP